MLAACATCHTRIFWVDSPYGGWWAHAVHPRDDHDAVAPEPIDSTKD